jgi:catechol 1,2-dioxygenase
MSYPTDTEQLMRAVLDATDASVQPRTRLQIESLIRHLHGFVRDVSLTLDELIAACNFLVEAGKISTGGRDEFVLLANIFGIEVLIDMISHGPGAQTAILGPMYRAAAPRLPSGENISRVPMPGAPTAFIEGFVTDAAGRPIRGASLEVWQASTNGLYDNEDPAQPDMNLRGVFTTDSDGYYAFRCLRPTPYPIPSDGPGGKLLQMLGRHPMRPAHIHFLISAEGKQAIVSQLYDAGCKYIDNDSIFAVKAPLVLDFRSDNGNHRTDFYVRFDWRMDDAGLDV